MSIGCLQLVAGVVLSHDALLLSLFVFGGRVRIVGVWLRGQVLSGVGVAALQTHSRLTRFLLMIKLFEHLIFANQSFLFLLDIGLHLCQLVLVYLLL